MDTWFCFIVKKESLELSILEELSSCAFQNGSFLEDLETGERSVYGTADEKLFPKTWSHIISYTKVSSEINWEKEWEAFSPYVQNGLATIPLSDFSPSKEQIFLRPGPGFGDLSHLTTSLSLNLLSSHALNQTIIDLGCGSGILGLAALKWGAQLVYSLDIDPEALDHTRANAALNSLERKILTSLSFPKNPPNNPTLLVMNMTFEDQKKAISSLPKNLNSIDYWITSGILKSQQKAYLSWAKKQGLVLNTLLSKEGWIGCLFKT